MYLITYNICLINIMRLDFNNMSYFFALATTHKYYILICLHLSEILKIS